MNSLICDGKAVKGQYMSSSQNGNPPKKKKNEFKSIIPVYYMQFVFRNKLFKNRFLTLHVIECHISTTANVIERLQTRCRKTRKEIIIAVK